MSDCKHEWHNEGEPFEVEFWECKHCEISREKWAIEEVERLESEIKEMRTILGDLFYENQDDGSLKFSIWINELKYDFLTGK